MDNIEIKENGNIYYRNGNREFKFVNMGEYVGYNTRNLNDPVPDCYRLMAYNEDQPDGVLHIEALIDPLGNYSRLIISKNLSERVVVLSGRFILEDYVSLADDSNEFVPKDKYIAFEDDFESKKLFEEYLQEAKTFKSDEGKTYSGDLTKDEYITYFLQKNQEYSHAVATPEESTPGL